MKNLIQHFWCCFSLILKEQIRKPSVYLVGGFCLLFLMLFQNVVRDGSELMSYGVVNEGGICAEEVISYLENVPDPFTLVRVESRKELERLVEAGQLDCGFVFDTRLDEISGIADMAGTIDYVCTTSTSRGPILQEKVYSASLRAAANKELITLARDGKTFKNKQDADAIEAMLLSSYEEYLEGDETLQVIFEYVDVSGTSGGQKNVFSPAETRKQKILAICKILLFAASLVFAGSRFSTRYAAIRKSLRGAYRPAFQISAVLSPMLPSSVILLCGYLYILNRIGLFTPETAVFSLLFFAGYVCLCTVWSCLYSKLFPNGSAYISSLIGVLLLSVLTENVLINAGTLVPALKILGWIIPG